MKKSLIVIVTACLLTVSLIVILLSVSQRVGKDKVAGGWLTIPLDHPESMSWGNTTELYNQNQKLISIGVKGHIGDRDYGEIFGESYALQEVNLDEPNPINWSSWRIFLYDYSTNDFTMLKIKTHNGSVSFGNPTFTFLTSPNGKKCIVVTYFLFEEGAGMDEAGELIFYKEIESENLTKQEIRKIFEDVTTATAYRYSSIDNLNCGLDTIKIIENPEGGYLGVYHYVLNGNFQARLATSTDLLNWIFIRIIEENASQPTIAKAPNGAYIIAFEKHLSNDEHRLGFHYYTNLQSLLSGNASANKVADLTLGNKTRLEGTPNIYNFTAVNSKMLVHVGFHYNYLEETAGLKILVIIAIVITVGITAAIAILMWRKMKIGYGSRENATSKLHISNYLLTNTAISRVRLLCT